MVQRIALTDLTEVRFLAGAPVSTNQEYMREYMLSRYHRRKREYQEHLGGKCVSCGATDNLHFHHRDPSEKLYTIGKVLAGLSKEKADAEVEKCELLCPDCHKAKHRSPHGTLARYKDCRCDACRSAWSKHSREYRQKRRAALVEKTHTPLLTDEKLERYQ